MKKLITLLIVFAAYHAFGQNGLWYFGHQAGIKFSPTPSATGLSGMVTNEGSSVATDNSGNLLFYTDGRQIWNDMHVSQFIPPVTITQNGLPVTLNQLLGGPSSTQSALILPIPGSNCDKFIIFTVPELDRWDGISNTYPNLGISENVGVRASIVDVTATSLIVPYNTTITSTPAQSNVVMATTVAGTILPVVEKLSAVSDGAGGFWVVCHGVSATGSNNFYSFHITAAINTLPLIKASMVTSSAGVAYNNSGTVNATTGLQTIRNAQGQLKFNQAGDKLVTALLGTRGVEMYDFDVNTGIVSNANTVYQNAGFADPYLAGMAEAAPFGCEFSPDGNYIYVTFGPANTNWISRVSYFTTAGPHTRGELRGINVGAGTTFGALQLAPDGKIYIAREGQSYVDAIKTPNSPTPYATPTDPVPYMSTATYIPSSVTLTAGAVCRIGLPTMVQSPWNCSPTLPPTGCMHHDSICNQYTFTVNDPAITNVTWYLDGQTVVQGGPTMTHSFSTGGMHIVHAMFLTEGEWFKCKDTVWVQMPDIIVSGSCLVANVIGTCQDPCLDDPSDISISVGGVLVYQNGVEVVPNVIYDLIVSPLSFHVQFDANDIDNTQTIVFSYTGCQGNVISFSKDHTPGECFCDCQNPTSGTNISFTYDAVTGVIDNNTISDYEIQQFTWDFGDGNYYVGQNPPPHFYSSAGTYNIILTVLTEGNGSNCVSADTVTVTLTQPNYQTMDCEEFMANVCNNSITSSWVPAGPGQRNYTFTPVLGTVPPPGYTIQNTAWQYEDVTLNTGMTISFYGPTPTNYTQTLLTNHHYYVLFIVIYTTPDGKGCVCISEVEIRTQNGGPIGPPNPPSPKSLMGGHDMMNMEKQKEECKTDMYIAPNPASDNFTATYKFCEGSAGNILIYDALGNLVTERKVSYKQGSVMFDSNTMPGGNYFVKLMAEDGTTITQRVIVQH